MDRSLISYSPLTSQNVNTPYSLINLANNLAKARIETTPDIWEIANSILFSDRLNERLTVAAVHKLACMLAVTDQLTFDAASLGIPFPAKYKPARSDASWESTWQQLYNEPMPTLGELYTHSHSILLQHARKDDPLIEHLIALSTLPQLLT